jgi:hypothetical protein
MKDVDLQRSIEQALAVEPRPEFAARVRRRIESERSRPWIRPRWAHLAAGLATAAALVSLVVLLPEKEKARPAKPVSVAAANQPPVPREEVTPEPSRVETSEPSAVVTRAVPKPGPAEPEVLIDPREAAAFYRFIEDVQERRIDPAKLEALFQASERAQRIVEIAPDPIASIDPIVVPPLVPVVPDNEGGSL